MNIGQVLVLVGVWLLAGAGQAATVTVSPLASNVANSSTFTIDIIGVGFPATEGGGFSVGFDPAILQVNGVTIDATVWNFINNVGVVDNSIGELNEVKVSAFPAVTTGNFIIATVELTAVGTGTSPLSLGPATGNPWASGGSLINPTFDQIGSVTVVPEPASLWLVVPVVGGLSRFGRRARRCHRTRMLV